VDAGCENGGIAGRMMMVFLDIPFHRSRFERHCHVAPPTVRLSDDEDYVNSAPHTRPPVERTLVKDVFALMDVDLSPDDHSVAYGVSGQPDLYVLGL
jgi:hypothetical protein